MGRAKRGLFAGKHIRFGNNVSEDGGNKTRRSWKPNVQRKKLYSDALQTMVSLKVTTHALRCIDKAGGLDNYILQSSPNKLQSDDSPVYFDPTGALKAGRRWLSRLGGICCGVHSCPNI
ncbi:hypothetical protein WJX74_006275 [Apatococcus lobatus]|uniref:Large ribosomal subunit protein bL28m n=1 Tax=Apatococcus lobatus TaxID=904363 RepID=A0AAW1RDJ3_9CHLO